MTKFPFWTYQKEAADLLDRCRGRPLNWDLFDSEDLEQCERLEEHLKLLDTISNHLESGRLVVFREIPTGYEMSVYE